jgi:hypothetical protein
MHVKSGIVKRSASRVYDTEQGKTQNILLSINDGTEEQICFMEGQIPHSILLEGQAVEIWYDEKNGRILRLVEAEQNELPKGGRAQFHILSRYLSTDEKEVNEYQDPTDKHFWIQKLKIVSNARLVCSSMWSDRSIVKDEEIGLHCRGDCALAVTNILKLGSRIKIAFCVYWLPIGTSAKSASVKSQIAHFISELPSEKFLHELKDIQQLIAWIDQKNLAIRYAKCWEAGIINPNNSIVKVLEEGRIKITDVNNPITKDLEDESINEWEYRDILLNVALYEHLWSLLLQKGDTIIALLKERWECSFNTNRELFQELLKSDFDVQYALILKTRHDIKAGDVEDLGSLRHKQIREGLSVEEQKRFINLARTLGGHRIWYERLQQVYEFLAEDDEYTRLWLEVKNAYSYASCGMLQDFVLDSSLRQYGYGRSQTWVYGKQYVNEKKSNLWKL